MKINILTFGPLNIHLASQQLSIPEPCTLNELNQMLQHTFPSLQRYPYIFAINKQVVDNWELLLKDGDEIAILPPFSGG